MIQHVYLFTLESTRGLLYILKPDDEIYHIILLSYQNKKQAFDRTSNEWYSIFTHQDNVY